jgi:hypothetical protein
MAEPGAARHARASYLPAMGELPRLVERLSAAGFSVRKRMGGGVEVDRPSEASPPTDVDVQRLADVEDLRELRLPRVDPTRLGPGFLHSLASLEAVWLWPTTLNADWTRALAALPRLSRLGITSGAFAPRSFEELAACPALQELNLQGYGRVHGPELAALAATPLERLHLHQLEPLTDGGAGLATLAGLRFLSLELGTAENEFVRVARQLPRLAELVVCDGPAGDAAIEALAGHPTLRSLSIYRCHTTPSGLDALRRLPGLERFATSGPGTEMPSLAPFEPLPALTSLDVSITAECTRFDALGQLPRLERLQVMGPYPHVPRFAEPGCLRVLNGRSVLRHLALQNVALGDADLADLMPAPALEHLSMEPASVTDAGLAALRHAPRLRHLFLSGSAITDTGLKHLRANRDLESLCLDGARIDGHGLRHLRHLPRLDCLMLNQCGLGDAAVRPLTELPALGCLHVVDHRMSRTAFEELDQTLARVWVDEHMGF